jgi:thiamine biosynthesis lipoprotein
MTFGGDGRTSHIFDPSLGRPVQPRWQSVSVSAPSAALADALSTAACVMDLKERIIALCDQMPGATLESAIPI